MTDRPDSAPGRDALGALSAAGQDAAIELETVFDAAMDRIAKSLENAAASGRLSFKRMVDDILADLARLAARRLVVEPILNAASSALGLGDIVSSARRAGARAGGGPVTPGHAYLVGERGPEWFSPATAGQISPTGAAARPVAVHVHLGAGADAGAIRRSESQLAAALASAVRRGFREL